MSIWTKSMYGVGNGFSYDAGNPVEPLGPDWGSQDSWWFRGPAYRALSPSKRSDGTVEKLPAGGSVTLEIACHYAWTSFGYSPTVPGSTLDACPGNAGSYHSGDPNAANIDPSLVSGCALAIADVDDISKVTMDNLVVFSVQHNCVRQKMTTFAIPAKMPPCTGSKCICGWFWLANNGTANFYMTAMDCAVTNSPPDALPIAAPVDPVFCPSGTGCATGAKRPLYAYNSPSNVKWVDNYNRPGYHASWSFGTNGAQNDIFVKSANVTSIKSASASSTKVASSTAISAAASSSSLAISSTATPVSASSATSTGAGAFSTPATRAIAAAAPTSTLDNLARTAITGASSWINGSDYSKAVDGSLTSEWVTNREGNNAWLAFDFGPTDITINQIVLYDRADAQNSIVNCAVMFSSQEVMYLGPLNKGGATTFNFTARATNSLLFGILEVSPSTTATGLAEIQIFNNPAVSGSTASSSVAAASSTAASTAVASSVAASSASSAAPVSTAALKNYARSATVSASTWTDNHEFEKVVDGLTSTSWISNGETVNAWLAFDFGSLITINQIVLYDLPSPDDHITSAAIMSSSQEILWLGPLNNDGSATYFNFTATQTDSLLFGVFGVSSTTDSAGLTEFQIFNNPNAVGGAAATAPVASATSAAAALASAGTDAGVAAPASASAPAAASTSGLTNYALAAQKSASSWISGWDYTKATDGRRSTSWVTNGETVGAWYALQFGAPTTLNQIVLYDRPNAEDQVLNCAIQFSSQEILWLGPLNNDGSATTFNFTARTTDSLLWGVFAVSSTTTRVGLTEIQLFNNPKAVVAGASSSSVVPSASATSAAAAFSAAATDAGISVSPSAAAARVASSAAPSVSSVASSSAAAASSSAQRAASSTASSLASSSAAQASSASKAASSTSVLASSASRSASSVASSSSASAAKASSAVSSAAAPSSVASSKVSSAVASSASVVQSVSSSSAAQSSASSTATSVAPAPTATLTNYAVAAEKAASSWSASNDWTKATDGLASTSWVTNGETVNAWYALNFTRTIPINQVVLYPLPASTGIITDCAVMFSDRSVLSLGALKSDGPTVFNFTEVQTSGLFFAVLGASSSSSAVGLAELQVYNNPSAVPGPAPAAAKNAAALAAINIIAGYSDAASPTTSSAPSAASSASKTASSAAPSTTSKAPAASSSATSKAASASATTKPARRWFQRATTEPTATPSSSSSSSSRHARDFTKRGDAAQPSAAAFAAAGLDLTAQGLFAGIQPEWNPPV
ncbi:hypothetical protein JCM10450v2_003119 [Rhodotorula kratochvilovae]